MKMLMLAYNEAIDREVMELLESYAVEGYTKWTQTLGSGKTSGPHLLSHVWPKGNNVLLCCVQDQIAENILNSVRELRKKIGKEGIKAFSLPVADLT